MLKEFLAKQVHLPYVGPISFWIIVFVLAPLGVILYFSFLLTGAWGVVIHTFTFSNYQALFRGEYLGVLSRTLYFALVTNLVCLLVGYPIAHTIAVYGGRWKVFLLFLVILPAWTCYLIRVYAIWSLVSFSGVISRVLMSLGLVSTPLVILGTPYIVMFGLVYIYIPYMILPIYASLDGLDPSLLDAAVDLGATPLKRFFTVILPLTKGGIFAGTILVFIPCVGEWIMPLLLGGGKSMLAGNLVAFYFTTVGNIPMGCSIAVILTAIIVLIMYLCVKGGGEEVWERQ